MFKQCKFCDKIIIRKPVNGCCDELHFKLWKKDYNAKYNKQKKEILLTEKYSSMLRICMRQFGEGVTFEAEILNHMGFDWEFSNEQVEVDGFLYNVIGEYGYIVFTNDKIKIKKL